MKTLKTANWPLSLRSAYLCLIAAMALVPLAGLSAQQLPCPDDKPVRCAGPLGTTAENSRVCCKSDQVCGISLLNQNPLCLDVFNSTQESEDCFSAAYGDLRVCMLRFDREQTICEHELHNAPGSKPDDHTSCREADRILADCKIKYNIDYFNCTQQSDGWEKPSLPRSALPQSPADSDEDAPSISTDLAPFTG